MSYPGNNDARPGPVSDHDINAWIDGELVDPERAEFAAAMIACPELASRVGALQTLKTLVRLAYAVDTLPQGDNSIDRDKTGSHG